MQSKVDKNNKKGQAKEIRMGKKRAQLDDLEKRFEQN